MCQILETTKKDGWYILSNKIGILWEFSIYLWCYLTQQWWIYYNISIMRYSIWNIVVILCWKMHENIFYLWVLVWNLNRIYYLSWLFYGKNFITNFCTMNDKARFLKPLRIESPYSSPLYLLIWYLFANIISRTRFKNARLLFFGIWRTYNVTACSIYIMFRFRLP